MANGKTEEKMLIEILLWLYLQTERIRFGSSVTGNKLKNEKKYYLLATSDLLFLT